MTVQDLIVRLNQYAEGAKRVEKFLSFDFAFAEYFAEYLESLENLRPGVDLDDIYLRKLVMLAFENLRTGKNQLAQEYRNYLEGLAFRPPNPTHDGAVADLSHVNSAIGVLEDVTGKDEIHGNLVREYLSMCEWRVIRKKADKFLREVYAEGLQGLMDKWSQDNITLNFGTTEVTVERGVSRVAHAFRDHPGFEKPGLLSEGDSGKLRRITLEREPEEQFKVGGGILFIAVHEDDPRGIYTRHVSHFSKTAAALAMISEVTEAWPDNPEEREEFFQEALVSR